MCKNKSIILVFVLLIIISSYSYADTIFVYGSHATSTLPDELPETHPGHNKMKWRYSALNLVDQDPSTVWSEGAQGDGIGESVTICLTSDYVQAKTINKLGIQAGYFKEPYFSYNNRIKKAKITVYSLIGSGNIKDREYVMEFEDIMETQYLNVGQRVRLHEIKIEILEIYPGTKWQDTCISGITFQDGNTNYKIDLVIPYLKYEKSDGIIRYKLKNWNINNPPLNFGVRENTYRYNNNYYGIHFIEKTGELKYTEYGSSLYINDKKIRISFDDGSELYDVFIGEPQDFVLGGEAVFSPKDCILYFNSKEGLFNFVLFSYDHTGDYVVELNLQFYLLEAATDSMCYDYAGLVLKMDISKGK